MIQKNATHICYPECTYSKLLKTVFFRVKHAIILEENEAFPRQGSNSSSASFQRNVTLKVEEGKVVQNVTVNLTF